MDSRRLDIVIAVADFPASVAFYRDLLGMAEVDAWDEGNGPGIVLRAGPGQTIELCGPPYAQRKVKEPASGFELSFEVDDVQAWYKTILAHGASIAHELHDNPWGDRAFGVDDPDGNRVWILEMIGRSG